jgi:hypothetical protein
MNVEIKFTYNPVIYDGGFPPLVEHYSHALLLHEPVELEGYWYNVTGFAQSDTNGGVDMTFALREITG